MLAEIAPSTIVIVMVGAIIISCLLCRIFLRLVNIPPIIGYIAIGIFINWLNSHYQFYISEVAHPIEFLAEIGIITLLFKVGLDCNLKDLWEQLPRASWIWFWNVIVSGALGFVTSFYLLEISLVPSLFIATALTATSIGVSVSLWKDTGLLNTQKGQLVLDVAELDDISSVALLALLLVVLPAIYLSDQSVSILLVSKSIGLFLFSFGLFVIFCAVFSVKIEPHISKFIAKHRKDHEPMLMIISLGIIIAALAEVLGLSLGIGAFFAGLAFSRDPEATKSHLCFVPIYEFFAPFFFVGIGLLIDVSIIFDSLYVGLILLVVAILGKVLGAGGPIIRQSGLTGALIVGISMVPRAEIAMIVMQKGLELGDWAVSKEVFSAMTLVVIGTTLITSLLLPLLLKNQRGAEL